MYAILFAGWVGLGCGSNHNTAPTSSEPSLENFTGTAWSTTEQSTYTCGTAKTTEPLVYDSITFTSSGTSLVRTNPDGCTFNLQWIGGDVMAANATDVTCSSATDAGITVWTWTNYSAQTSDGHHITITQTGSEVTNGGRCTIQTTATGTR